MALFWLTTIASILIAIAILLVLRREGGERRDEEPDEGLESWTCPSCGFQVQLGTACIYCGETKRQEEERSE